MTFKFIPNPTGNAMTDQDFVRSAVQRERDHQHLVEQKLIFSLVGLAVLFLVIFILVKWRPIASSISEALVCALAAGVKGKRRVEEISEGVKARVYEKVDGSSEVGGLKENPPKKIPPIFPDQA